MPSGRSSGDQVLGLLGHEVVDAGPGALRVGLEGKGLDPGVEEASQGLVVAVDGDEAGVGELAVGQAHGGVGDSGDRLLQGVEGGEAGVAADRVGEQRLERVGGGTAGAGVGHSQGEPDRQGREHDARPVGLAGGVGEQVVAHLVQPGGESGSVRGVGRQPLHEQLGELFPWLRRPDRRRPLAQ